MSSPGFASCRCSRTDLRSDEDFPDFDTGSTRMAAGDPSPVHICTPFCSGQHGDQLEVTGLQFHSRSRYGLRGVRVGEASHPGPATPSSSSPPNEELLQFLEQNLSSRTRRRVRRRVRDSDSDGPLTSRSSFRGGGAEVRWGRGESCWSQQCHRAHPNLFRIGSNPVQ